MNQLSAVANQLGIDNTFLPLFFMFMFLYLILRTVYFRPFQKLLHEREQKTEGAKTEAKTLVERAEEMMANYKSAIKGAHENARKTLNVADVEAKKEESKIISDASMKAKEFAQKNQQNIEAQKKEVLSQVQSEIPNLANEIVYKILGRKA